jgi:DNA-damage-inducible protein D
MREPESSQLVPHNLSFESLKKLNEHGVEYWSARDLQPLLGYAKWQRFENALKKAIESCKMSGNNPDHHFTGSGK